MRRLEDRSNGTFVSAIRFVRNPTKFRSQPLPLIIDGVDELTTTHEAHSVDLVIGALEEIDCPNCIISCRGIEWKDALDREELTDAYDTAPVVYDLMPLTRQDAEEYLLNFKDRDGEPIKNGAGEYIFTHDKIENALDKLEGSGLVGLYTNAFDLSLLAESLADGVLPTDKGELYEHATGRHARESSIRYEESAQKLNINSEVIIDAAGLISLAELLSGAGYVALTESAKDGTAILKSELSDLPRFRAFEFACGSRFIDGMSGNRKVRPVHRAMGDYLAARYIRRVVNLSDNRLARRVWRTLVPDKKPSGDRRGLIAWLALDPAFQDKAFVGDPVGYVYYGETEKLSTSGTLALIEALVEYSKERPEFYRRQGRWDESGRLGRGEREVVSQLKRIIFSDRQISDLKMFLLDQLYDSPETSAELLTELTGLFRDQSTPFGLRFRALRILLQLNDEHSDWGSILEELNSERSYEAVKLGLDILKDRGGEEFSARQIATLIVGSCQLDPEVKREGYKISGLLWRVPEKINAEKLDEVLAILRTAPVFDEPIKYRSRNRESSPDWLELGRFVNEVLIKIEESLGADTNRSLTWYQIAEDRYISKDLETKSANFRFRERLRTDCEVASEAIVTVKSSERRSPKNPDSIWNPHFNEVFRPETISDVVAIAYLEFLNRLQAESNVIDDNAFRIFARIFDQPDSFPKALPFAKELTKSGGPFECFSEEAIKDRRIEISSKDRALEREFDAKEREQDAEWSQHVALVKSGLSQRPQSEDAVNYLCTAVLGRKSNISGDMASYDTVKDDFGQDTIKDLENFLASAVNSDEKISFENFLTKSLEGYYFFPVIHAMAEAQIRFIDQKGFNEFDSNHREILWLASQSNHYRSYHLLNELADSFEAELGVETARKAELIDLAVRAQLQNDPTGLGNGIISLQNSIKIDDKTRLAELLIGWLEDFSQLDWIVQDNLLRQLQSISLLGTWRVQLAKLAKNKSTEISKKIQSENHRKNIGNENADSDRSLMDNLHQQFRRWNAIAFVFDREGPLPKSEVSFELLKAIYSVHASANHGHEQHKLTSRQIEKLVSRFRSITDEPDQDFDQYHFGPGGEKYLRSVINSISDIKAEDAIEALRKLTKVDDKYKDVITTILSEIEHKESAKSAETLTADGLKAMLMDGLPETPSQFLALGQELFEALQARVNSSKLDTYRLFYRDPSKPKPKKNAPKAELGAWNPWDNPKAENACNKIVAEVLEVPPGIVQNVELQMANEKLADIGLELPGLILPIEAKGQWNPEIYSAAMGQLDKKYAAHFQAKGFGILLIYWFGLDVVSSKKPAKCPIRKKRPNSVAEIKDWVEQTIPEKHSDRIKVVILDLTAGTA